MRGISFPFRIGIRGGVVMSEDTHMDLPHLGEAVQQVILTSVGERPMLPNFGSEIDTSVYEPDSQSSRTMLEFQVKEAIKAHLSDRLILRGVTSYFEDSSIFVKVRFSSTEFEDLEAVETVKIGDENA